jgi:hypothetical protein
MAVRVKSKDPVPKKPDSYDFFNWNAPTGSPKKPVPPGPYRTPDDPAYVPLNFSDFNNVGLQQIPPRGHAQSGLAKNPSASADPSLLDYLSQALGITGSMNDSTGGTDYTGLESVLRQNASDADSRIGAMYRQLQGSYVNDAAPIAAGYDQAHQALAGNADQATQQVNAGYGAARDAQTKMLQNLGIGDAALVQANQGNPGGADQARALSGIAQNSLANLNANDANKQSAASYNTKIGGAAGLEGNLQRASVQQNLQKALAQLEAQKSQSASTAKSNNFSQALGLAEALSSDQQNRQHYTDAQQAAAAKAAGGSTIQDYIDQYAALLAQNGGDSDAALKQLQALKVVKGLN